MKDEVPLRRCLSTASLLPLSPFCLSPTPSTSLRAVPTVRAVPVPYSPFCLSLTPLFRRAVPVPYFTSTSGPRYLSGTESRHFTD